MSGPQLIVSDHKGVEILLAANQTLLFISEKKNNMKKSDELSAGVLYSMERGLQSNSMWCAEMLAGLSDESMNEEVMWTGCQEQESNDENLSDGISQALLLMQNEEYIRASHLIKEIPQSVKSSHATFIALYSKWLDGENKLQERYLDKLTLLSPQKHRNEHSDELYQKLSLLNARGVIDGALLYLFGIVLLERGQKEDSMGMLLRSVSHTPLLWVAWKTLADIAGVSILHDVAKTLPHPHWIAQVFEAHLALKNYNPDALQKYQTLDIMYPKSSPITCSVACVAYDKGRTDLARSYFERSIESDPYRIEGLDSYSNTLYMFRDGTTLSLLAHRVFQIQPYRPETHCILGNLHSLQKDNDKAVHHFQRALQLRFNYPNAWTFLGHEYSPYQGGVGNVRGCIFAYNKALELDSRDFRAWLGLAQTYYSELNLPVQANYYAEKSVAIRPNDKRLKEIAAMIRSKAEMWIRPGGVTICTPTSGGSSDF